MLVKGVWHSGITYVGQTSVIIEWELEDRVEALRRCSCGVKRTSRTVDEDTVQMAADVDSW